MFGTHSQNMWGAPDTLKSADCPALVWWENHALLAGCVTLLLAATLALHFRRRDHRVEIAEEATCRSLNPQSLRLPNAQPSALVDGDAPPRGGGTAVLIVDIQTCWYSQSPVLRAAFPNLPETTATLLCHARQRGLPVIHIRAAYQSAMHVSTVCRLNPGLNASVAIDPTEVEPWASEMAGEAVVLKGTFDGFFHTELESILCSLGVTRVLIGGLVTASCVLNTAFGAFHRGFDVVLIEDCCADRSIERHQAAISMYSDYVFRTCTTRDLHRVDCGHVLAASPLGTAGKSALAPPWATIDETNSSPVAIGGGGPGGGALPCSSAAFKLGFEGNVSPSTTLTDLPKLANGGGGE